MGGDIGHGTPERRSRAIKLLEADFHGLLQVKEITEVNQAKLAVAMVRSVSRLSTVADDRAGIRQFCQRVLNLDPNNNMVEIAAIIDAWESCTTRMSVRHKAEAEATLSSQPRAVNKVELARFESIHGYKLKDRTTPAASALEQIFDQVENGEFKNMSLVQFVSREDAEAEVTGAVIEKGTGVIKIKKGFGECPKPRNPEEFRRRMAVLAHAYLLAQMLKYPQEAALRELQPQTFLKYVELMLGDHVLGLKAKNKDGTTIASPDFELLLAYDYQVRRHMVKQVNEGHAMVEALQPAMKDTTIKERYFLTPNVYSQVAAQWNHGGDSGYAAGERGRSRSPLRRYSDAPWHHKGKGKGKKGAGKSKKGAKGKLHDRTPDGRQICYKWNSPTERCRFDCGRLHVCQICFGKRPYHACPGSSAKDTAGEGDKKEQ